MYASDLAYFLCESMQQADVGNPSFTDFEERMNSLRRYGRLPQGRENHAALLTEEHIVNAVLGLASDKPAWAGHSSIVLAKLQPVGGPRASFRKSPTLSAALELLLRDETALRQLIMLSVSTSEFATNSKGRAKITWLENREVYSTNFVSGMALSLFQPDAEKHFDELRFHAPITKQIIFDQRFFKKLVDKISSHRRLKPGPASDGHEYDAEEAQKRRFEKLGVRQGSRYLNMGVDNQVAWPKEETLINFDRYTLVLFPKAKDHVQSISMDLIANNLSEEEAQTVINRFLSLMTWCNDQFAVAQPNSSGSHVPCAVNRRELSFVTASHWYFDRKIPETEKKQLALAL